jgi:hypothetical protein
MTVYQNQLKNFIKVRVPCNGTNKCEPTESFLTINRTSSVIIKKGTCLLISAATPGDRNVMKKEAEKILK